MCNVKREQLGAPLKVYVQQVYWESTVKECVQCDHKRSTIEVYLHGGASSNSTWRMDSEEAQSKNTCNVNRWVHHQSICAVNNTDNPYERMPPKWTPGRHCQRLLTTWKKSKQRKRTLATWTTDKQKHSVKPRRSTFKVHVQRETWGRTVKEKVQRDHQACTDNRNVNTGKAQRKTTCN